MPKPRRPEHRSLPARWRHKHGAYYFRVPRGLEAEWDGKQEFRLGVSLAEAYRVWALRLESTEEIRVLGDLFDRYAAEVVPTKAPKTQVSNALSLRRLRSVFGHVSITALKPKHAYKYRDEVTKRHGAASANRDLEVLSHSLSKAVEWGVIDRNPIKGQVRKNQMRRRERYIEDWELREALRAANPMLRSYIVLKLLTGLRRSDLLRLTKDQLKSDGIHVRTSKTGTRLVIAWTPQLRTAVRHALESRPSQIGLWLFCTRNGGCFVKANGTASGFDSLWRRFMVRALAITGLKGSFQEKDLRKKTASDMKLSEATRLLGHSSSQTTTKHYRLRGDTVEPHSLNDDMLAGG